MTMNVALSPEQEAVAQMAQNGENLLITGSAGTGKSTLLRELGRRFKGDLPIAASTGIAAVNVGGMTLHSWAGLGMGQESAEEIAENLEQSRRAPYGRITKAKRLAIDEVSMIHGDLFDLTDRVFRILRKDERPFGGVQLILFGDFLQLPPVSRETQQKFAFQSDSWRAANIRVNILTKVFRQSDALFSSALNEIRVGNMTEEVKELLRSRYRVADSTPSIEPVTVFTHNTDVDVLNAKRLATITGEERQYPARDWGQPAALSVLQKHCLAPETLRLKVGAQVMLLRNLDPLNGLANGSIGTVESFSVMKRPVVAFANGRTREIDDHKWEIKSGGDVLAVREQIPLRLAWAITAHKSQGMTLDKIRVHLGKVFEYGQSYVALSRARTLDGLFIESTAPGCIKAHPEAVRFYEQAACAPVAIPEFALA